MKLFSYSYFINVRISALVIGFICVFTNSTTAQTYTSGSVTPCTVAGTYYLVTGPFNGGILVRSEDCAGGLISGNTSAATDHVNTCEGLSDVLRMMGPDNTVEFQCGGVPEYPIEYCIPSTDIPPDAATVTIGIRDENGDRFFEIAIGDLEREIGVCLGNYYDVTSPGNYTATHRFDWVDPTPDPNDPFIPEPPPDGSSDKPLSVYILGQPIAVTLSDQPISVIVQNELQANLDDSSIVQGLTSLRNEVAGQALATRNDMNQNNADLITAIDENHLEIKDKMDDHFGILTNILSKGSDTYGDSDTEIVGLIQQATQLEIEAESYNAINWNPSNAKECSYTIGTGIPYIGQISINLCDIPLIPNIRAMLLVFVTITQYLFFFFLAMQVFKVVK